MEFADKVVIITGSSRGIGRATALAFVKAGAFVTIHGQNAEKLNETKELIRQAGAKEIQICAVLGPIEEEATARELVEKTVQTFGKIDVLVNNAGIGRKPGVEDRHSLETFDYLFAVNVRSIVQLTTLATPELAKTKGCVINISSIASSMPFMKNPYYGMTKAALDHYTKDVANMLGQKHGIRVNSVNPGPIESEFGSRWEVPGQNEDEYAKQLRERFMARLISGRFGSCEEAAEVIKFLASPRASYIWGSHKIRRILGQKFVQRSWAWLLHCAAMIVMFGVCYWIILVCFIKTRHHIVGIYGECAKNNLKSGKCAEKRKVKTKVVEMANARKNDRLREYNAQVTTAFVVQAILPTIEVIELTVQTTLPIFLASEQTIHFMVYAAIPLYFIPVLNPLATMLLVKPYQMAVLKMLGLKTIQKKTATMTQKQLIPTNFVQSTTNCRKIPVSPQAVQPMFSIA